MRGLRFPVRSRSSCGARLGPGSGRTGRRQVRKSVAVRRGVRSAGEDGTVESLTRLGEQRAFYCRLSPDRALGSVEEADAFLRDRGLLTRTADCALPSLYEACHEDPYRPGSPGFATWPATKWPWFGELAGRGHLIAAVHRGKSLLACGAVARLLDPICRAEITRMRAADRGWGRLLDHLAAVGPSSIEDLRAELGLKRQELRGCRRRWSGAARSCRARCTLPPARDTSIPASWRAGIRPTRAAAAPARIP